MNIKKFESRFEKIKPYFVVGDAQFKKKYCEGQNNTVNYGTAHFKNI